MPRGRRSTVNNVGSLLGDAESATHGSLGGAVVYATATGLGVWASLQAKAIVVTQTAEKQIFLERAWVGYPRAVWWTFAVVTVVAAVLRLGMNGVECEGFCEGGYCAGWGEGAGNSSSQYCTETLVHTPEFNRRLFVTAILSENVSSKVSVTHQGCNTTLTRVLTSTSPTPLGWFSTYTPTHTLTLTAPPTVDVVLLQTPSTYIHADLVLRVISTVAAVCLIVVLCKRIDTRPARTGPATIGVSQSLSIWFIILLVGWVMQCNVVYFIAPSSSFATFIEEYGTSFVIYAYYALCIFILRLCYVGMSVKTGSILKAHAHPSAYLFFSLMIHSLASIAASGPPFSTTTSHATQMQRPSPPVWVFVIVATYHGCWFLWAVTTGLAVVRKVSKIPYTPFAAYVLLFRWFTHVGAVHIIVHWCIEVRLIITNDMYTHPFRPNLADIFTTGVFIIFMLLGVFPLPPEVEDSPLPPTSPGGSWRSRTWTRELVNALPTADRRLHSYYFGTIRHWRVWAQNVAKGVKQPPMFCLELADWMWAVAWEVHASDRRMMYYWRQISMCEAAALAAVPDEFSSYARKYADEELLRVDASLQSPETPAMKWYEKLQVVPVSRFHTYTDSSHTSPRSVSQMRFRLEASGELTEADADPLHMRGHDKAQIIMDWSKLGVAPMPVVARGFNQACVTYSPSGIAIAFRGTLNLDNVKSDLQACMHTTQPDNLSGFCKHVLKVHSGFLRIWNSYLRKDVVVQVMHLMCTEHGKSDDVQDSWRRGGPAVGKSRRPVLITGHSLGGALAVLCAYDLQKQVLGQLDELLDSEVDGRNAIKQAWREATNHALEGAGSVLRIDVDDYIVDSSISSESAAEWDDAEATHSSRSVVVYTFGSPRVGNLAWKAAYDEALPHTFRIVNGEDLVPHLPPSTGRIGGWSHVGKLVVISTQGDLRIDPNTADRKLAYSPLFPWQRTLGDHRMGAYREAMLAVAYARNLARAVRFVDDCKQEEQSTTGAMVMQQLIRHQRGESWDMGRHRRGGMPILPEESEVEEVHDPFAHSDNMKPTFLAL